MLLLIDGLHCNKKLAAPVSSVSYILLIIKRICLLGTLICIVSVLIEMTLAAFTLQAKVGQIPLFFPICDPYLIFFTTV